MYLGARSGDIYFLVFGMCFVLGFGGMWGCVSAVGSGSGFRSGFACVMAAQACAHEWGGGRGVWVGVNRFAVSGWLRFTSHGRSLILPL